LKRWIAAAAAAIAWLSGCAAYQPQTLPGRTSAPDLAHLTVDADAMPLPALAVHRFDPSDGLDMTEVAMLAVVNNPDLKLARDDAAIAHAQAFAAGLLPDPQLALAHDWNNTGPDGIRAFNLGLNVDITSLLLHSSVEAARSDDRKTDLNLLWQECQVVSQARLLFVKLSQGKKAAAVLEQTHALFADRVARMQAALQRGLIDSAAVAPNLAALQDVQKQGFDLARQENQDRHDLNALLGLAPGTVLDLREGPDEEAPAPADALAALPQLASRRPDLLALQAGYKAQDQRYRGAILAQFPALTLGLARSRDSSGIYSNAVGATLSLPFLNRNRGNIAIEAATRQRLADEYGQRLQTAENDIHRLLDEQALNARQLALDDLAIAELGKTLAGSEMAYRASNVDALIYAGARAALLAKQLERIGVEQASLEQGVALQTLLGIAPRAQETTP
jgi:outer membrane protein TolC